MQYIKIKIVKCLMICGHELPYRDLRGPSQPTSLACLSEVKGITAVQQLSSESSGNDRI